MTSSPRLRVAVAALALATLAGCRAPSGLRPAFTREKDLNAGNVSGTVLFTTKISSGYAIARVDLGAGYRKVAKVVYKGFSDPVASPDGTQIAMIRNGTRPGLYVGDLDGGTPKRLTDESGIYERASWSPDGETIVYAYGPTDQRAPLQLFTVSASGRGRQQITRGETSSYSPSWSPVSNEIVYTSETDGDPAIWVVDGEGGDPAKLVDDPEWADSQPAWSPDGTRIAFVSDREFERSQLFVYDVASQKVDNLVRTNQADRFPAWSPDGLTLSASTGYLALYRGDSKKFPGDANRLKATDSLSLTSTWVA